LAAQALGHASGVRPPARLPLRAPNYSPGELVPADDSVARANADSAADSTESAAHASNFPSASNIPTASNVPSGNRPVHPHPNDSVEAMPGAPVVAERPTASHQDRTVHQDGTVRRSRRDQAHPRHEEHQAGTEPVARSHRDTPADATPELHPRAELRANSPLRGDVGSEAAAAGQSLSDLVHRRARFSLKNAPADEAPQNAQDGSAARESESSTPEPRGMTRQVSETPPRAATRRAGEGPVPRHAESRISRQRTMTEHAPDVHIHIGRVELSAVMAPAAAQRKSSSNGKKPMSLDDYLRRRDGRGP